MTAPADEPAALEFDDDDSATQEHLQTASLTAKPKSTEGLTGQQTYNLVTDTVTGVNLRLADNLIQGLAVFAGCVCGAGIGALVAEERVAGALIGGLIGVIVGLFTSGIGLMIYRGLKHLKGRHD
jgi:hypothetical protein